MSLETKRQAAKPIANGKPGETAPVWHQKPAAGAPGVGAGVTAAELIAKAFDPPRFLIGDLLTEGLTIMGGKPKHGKSWLALLLGWAVAAGEAVDGRASMQGEVLYLALEDTDRRLQGRLAKLRDALKWPVPETLRLQTRWPRAPEGGLYHLAEWLSANKTNARLVIVDTLAKFRAPQKGTGNNYADDYEAVGDFKQMLDEYGVSGLMLHHTRKLRSEDPFDEISGTLAITGAADSIWMLDTQKKGEDARLYVTGRDMADATIAIRFEKDSGRWAVGASEDGINTTGRETTAGAGESATKAQKCRAWLLGYLKEYAYPSADIEAAGLAAGFARSMIRDTKAALGSKGSGEVVHRNFGGDQNNDWWSGLGPSALWKKRVLDIPM